MRAISKIRRYLCVVNVQFQVLTLYRFVKKVTFLSTIVQILPSVTIQYVFESSNKTDSKLIVPYFVITVKLEIVQRSSSITVSTQYFTTELVRKHTHKKLTPLMLQHCDISVFRKFVRAVDLNVWISAECNKMFSKQSSAGRIVVRRVLSLMGIIYWSLCEKLVEWVDGTQLKPEIYKYLSRFTFVTTKQHIVNHHIQNREYSHHFLMHL